MVEKLRDSAIFMGMSEKEMEDCLTCSLSKEIAYEKDEMVFCQGDPPDRLMVLLEGTIVIGSDSRDGRRSIVASFSQPGDLFGEVFLFLNRRTYDHYAQAATAVRILQIPRDFLCHTCEKNCGYHEKLISNMLSILAQKAYLLNRRLQVISCATLRRKIALVLLQNASDDGRTILHMNREELADYLNAARPSVSRELMQMQRDGFLKIDKKCIYGIPERLQELF